MKNEKSARPDASLHGVNPRVRARDRGEWRTWLEEHHETAEVVWLVFYKKHTGKPSIEYRESVEEALCFGWIDGLKRRLDDERYAYRFTPRRARSRWSSLNVRLANEQIEQGRMTPAGLAAFERRVRDAGERSESRPRPDGTLPPEAERALRAHPRAWRNYQALAPSYRKQYALWLSVAVKPETRARRLEQAIALLEDNQKLGMK
jgi:uncharacterized protein YdeI (YjbR/CyaY-like superfamily)